jgi:hypothetical protein
MAVAAWFFDHWPPLRDPTVPLIVRELGLDAGRETKQNPDE